MPDTRARDIPATDAVFLNAQPVVDRDTGRREILVWLDVEGQTVRLALSHEDADELAGEIDDCLDSVGYGEEDECGEL